MSDPTQGSLFGDGVQALMDARDQFSAQIKSIQDSCLHHGATKIPKADTGNWDRGDDRYWYECKCQLCLKQWTEDQ